MTGNELITYTQEANGGATIGQTLLLTKLNFVKAIIEQMREWMILRNTDTSKSVSSAVNAWQNEIDLSDIELFNRFYGEFPIKLFDGNNRIEYFRQVPFHKRLQYREATNTFVYDEASQKLYLNGSVNFAGTLWIDHLKTTPDVTADNTNAWAFPSWSHPILGDLAVASHKAGIDYDEVNARQAVANNSDAARILNALVKWDDEKQLQALAQHDPTVGPTEGYRPGAVDMNV